MVLSLAVCASSTGLIVPTTTVPSPIVNTIVHANGNFRQLPKPAPSTASRLVFPAEAKLPTTFLLGGGNPFVKEVCATT